MALGNRYSAGMGGIPDYIGMGQKASQEGFQEAQSIGNQLNQGFTLGSKMGDRARQQQARKVFGDAWASGDPKAIEQAMQLFPEYAEQAQKFIGIRDDQHRKDAGSLMMKLNALAGTGDAQGIIDAVNGSGDILDTSAKQQLIKQAQLLADSDQAKSRAGKDFLDRYTKGMAVSTLSPLEAINYGTDQQKLALNQQQINNQLQLGEGRLALGQGQLGLGYARLAQMRDFQSMTPAERNFAYFQGLSPDEQKQFAQFLPGAGLGARMDMQQKRLLQSQIKDTIKGPQQKQYYMQMAEKAIEQLDNYKKTGNKAGAAEAYHNVRNALARAAMGGNATLNEAQIEQATGLPAFMDEKANTLGLKVNGMPSKMFMDSTRQQIKDDLQNERDTIKNQGQQFYSSLVAQGMDPTEANNMINGALTGTAIGAQDWSGESDSGKGKSGDKKDHSGLWD